MIARSRAEELAAITKAFGRRSIPEYPGVKIGGGEFILTSRQRKYFERKKSRIMHPAE